MRRETGGKGKICEEKRKMIMKRIIRVKKGEQWLS